jgi:hypothetical protein
MRRDTTSDVLFRRAAAAYDRLAARIEATGDPDLDLGAVHSCGRRRLLARARARAWTVPAHLARRAEELLRVIEQADQDSCVDWLEAFPGEIARALERRDPLAAPPPGAPRRRTLDGVGRPTAVPMPS